MFGVLNVLLVGFLLHGVLGKYFGVSLPKEVEAMRGLCVTIPCSFTIKDENDLHSRCRALWKTNGKTLRGETEHLTQKICTTTLYNINDRHRGTYYFRLECPRTLNYSFKKFKVNIKVTDAPPALTLTPSSLSATEGESVTVDCSAPVPCLSVPPALTWSPVLGDVQETLRKQDSAFVKVSTLSFTAAHSHHGKDITCSAVYSREDIAFVSRLSAQIKAEVTYRPRDVRVTVDPLGPVTELSNVTMTCSSEAHPPAQLYLWYKTDGGTHALIGNSSVLNLKASKDTTAVFCEARNEVGTNNSSVTQLNIHFVPKIMSSSNCTGDASQMSCACEAEGNPSPLIQWHFPGVSTNISFTNEALSDTSVRSVITVKDAQWKSPVTLLCHSSNSLGSDQRMFTVSMLDNAPEEEQVLGSVNVLAPVLIGSVVALMVLVLVLLCVVRALVVRLKAPPSPPSPPEVTESEGAAEDATNRDPDNVLYSSLNWKTKNTKTEQGPEGDTQPSCGSYLEEQRGIVGDGRNSIIGKEAECEYAQVKFKAPAATNQPIYDNVKGEM